MATAGSLSGCWHWANPGARIIPPFRPGSLTSLDNGPAPGIAIGKCNFEHVHHNDATHTHTDSTYPWAIDSGSTQASSYKKATTMETIPGRGATVGALAVASPYGGLPVSLIESDAPGKLRLRLRLRLTLCSCNHEINNIAMIANNKAIWRL